MHLRTIVPTLGLAAASIGSTYAVEIGSVTLGGYVDAIVSVVDNEEFADTDPNIDFSGMAELQVGARIGDRVSLQTDLEFYGSKQEDSDGDMYNVLVEQAYVAYGVTDTVTLQLGKWEGLIGYEAWDATGLWRVNTSPIFDQNGVLVEGLDVNIKANEKLVVDLYIADGVYVEDQQVSDSFGLGASLTYTEADLFMVDLDLGIDMDGLPGESADEGEAIFGLNISGEYTGIEKLALFGDIAYRDLDEAVLMGLMVGGNYQFTERASGTVMISYLEPNDEVDDDEQIEFAVAALTNPTGDSNFAINYELSWLNSASDDAEDQVGLFVEFLAVIP